MNELMARTRQAQTTAELDEIERDSFKLTYLERQYVMTEVSWRYRKICGF